MNKKIYCFTLIYLISINFAFTNNVESFYDNKQVLPISDYIGQIDFGDQRSLSNYIKDMMSQEYNIKWIESYVNNDYQYVFTKKYSKIFLDLLPIKDNFYCSKEKKYKNNKAISIYFDKNRIITLLLNNKENKIINVNFSQYLF